MRKERKVRYLIERLGSTVRFFYPSGVSFSSVLTEQASELAPFGRYSSQTSELMSEEDEGPKSSLHTLEDVKWNPSMTFVGVSVPNMK
ncbi:hypothetical protein X801_03319 [Opisthorchis viverrini]|uniref:Uncharacterized protein n=2 Tax=Opisthorchis viverrini TaxID=6198 RepID=A0A1S8X2S6_OPIVI|nr:hypothetical protein T265_04990 [Opisthorchis viverrini]KER28076.1 hypothetical protein T265_04990 [Opisthorchis viverrini]OON20793.1 hypothetical protein X801_03319 [Opisthorchis viverrini]